MSESPTELTGPDFVSGIPLATLAVGAMVQGHAFGAPVLLVRRTESIVAVGAYCTHYGAALADGVLDGDTVRCPLHHACFSVDTGRALHAPAFDALPRWAVEVRDATVFVTSALTATETPPPRAATRDVTRNAAEGATRDATYNTTRNAIHNATRDTGKDGTRNQSLAARMVIVGGGAAGDAAAAMLREQGYDGEITMLSADHHAPGDRPNFSKGTISGTVAMDFNFVRPSGFYEEHHISLRLNTTVTSIDTNNRAVQLADGEVVPYDALLLATGAEPIRLTIPGADLPHVRTLRTLADSLDIAERASHAKSVVVIGASFIGMEVAAALRARKVEVHIVAPEDVPMARVLGPELGAFMQSLHERHGVTFHLGTTVSAIEADHVRLANGEVVRADLVVAGIGVRPSLALATQAGLAIDKGVLVNSRLETSIPGIFAAGDIARWLDDTTGVRTRVEHWVVAQRQGQVAARNMLGANEVFNAIPFFWTEQYDLLLQYVGHAEPGFTTEVVGSLTDASPNVRVNFRNDGQLVAVATVGRDRESLEAELAFERARTAKH